MNLIKGFVTINQYVSNVAGVTAPLGELSTWSLTYSKERGEYRDNNILGYSLTTFKSIDSVSGNPVVVPNTQTTQILQLTAACVSYATTHIRPYVSDDFRNTILAQFNARISNLNFGSYIDNGSFALPAWISWTSTEHSGSIIKIWLSDQAFIDQYDEYEIEVIPPLDTLDNFFGLFSVVNNAIDSRDLNELTDQITIVKGIHPETYLRIFNFDFINIANTSQSHKTSWAILVYGKAGDNIDAIKDAIVSYVLANSTYSNSEWEAILPDLFKRTEFVILPRWDLISIPNLSLQSALYSSILNPTECKDFAVNNIDFYTEQHIQSNINILPYDYKAISLVCIDGQSNITGKEHILDIIPDYIPVPSTSTDFNRMQISTRNWILTMDNLLILAETANEFTSMPANTRRLMRSNVMFISTLLDGVNYLVAAKINSFYNIP
jgi:hypothetical protein